VWVCFSAETLCFQLVDRSIYAIRLRYSHIVASDAIAHTMDRHYHVEVMAMNISEQHVHPGEVLEEAFLKPMKLSQNRVALDMRVPARRINEIVLGKRRISPDTALRLARYFGTTPQFWLHLQMEHDLEVAEATIGQRIEREVVTQITA
jgi:addiction module HigA family antidote